MNKQLCIVPDCDRTTVAKGLCHKHWKRMRSNGTLELQRRNYKGMDEQERFWMYVNKQGKPHPIFPTPCWEWTGSLIKGGYALFRLSSTNPSQQEKILAHRYSFELTYYPIPEGMEIDHMCKTRHCVNPDHLDLVTRQENIDRSQKSECLRGHPYSPENTKIKRSGKGYKRVCQLCQKIWSQTDIQRRRNARQASVRQQSI